MIFVEIKSVKVWDLLCIFTHLELKIQSSKTVLTFSNLWPRVMTHTHIHFTTTEKLQMYLWRLKVSPRLQYIGRNVDLQQKRTSLIKKTLFPSSETVKISITLRRRVGSDTCSDCVSVLWWREVLVFIRLASLSCRCHRVSDGVALSQHGAVSHSHDLWTLRYAFKRLKHEANLTRPLASLVFTHALFYFRVFQLMAF